MFSTHLPVNANQSNYMNRTISHLVVQILIEMTKRCIKNRNFWLENLKRLALRMQVLKNFLGGSAFVLEGFTALLKVSDPELRGEIY